MLRSNRFLGPRFVFRTPARVGGTHSGALCVGSGSGLALWLLLPSCCERSQLPEHCRYRSI